MRILSVGDSWSAGVWNIDNDKHVVVDTGYQRQLSQIGTVKNIWSYNNNQALKNLYLHHEDYDVVLFFFTDPFRDVSHYQKRYSFFVNNIRTAGELLSTHEALLESTIQSLNVLGSKVKIIGGCQSLNHRNDDNIIVPCASEFVTRNKYKHPLLWDTGWSSMINFDKCKRDLLREIDRNRLMQDAMESPRFKKYFWPDGYHLNKRSNNILGEHLVKILTS